jgi:septal ring factor EnvC (AmiA/AmiB activator)
MDGVIGIIAVLAFLISLAAIWMAADVIRRNDASNRAFYEANIKTLREAVAERKTEADGLRREISALEKDAAEARTTAERAEARAASIENAMRALAEGLSSLDRSIPQRFRSGSRTASSDVHKTDDQTNLQ